MSDVTPTISRPLVSLLESAVTTPTGSMLTDIDRLRDALTVVLQRYLAADDGWSALVDRAAARAEWSEWRVHSLHAAAAPATDPTPEVTRDELAEVATELIERGSLLPGPWEGRDRQGAVESAEWQAGKRRRELVFGIERAMSCISTRSAFGLRACAETISQYDPEDERYPGLCSALLTCADRFDDDLALGEAELSLLRASLGGTPFAAFVVD